MLLFWNYKQGAKQSHTMFIGMKQEENQIEAALTVRSPPGDL